MSRDRDRAHRVSIGGALALAVTLGVIPVATPALARADLDDALIESLAADLFGWLFPADAALDATDPNPAAASGAGIDFALIPMSGGRFPYINIEVDGAHVPVLVDTGSEGLFIPLEEFDIHTNTLTSIFDALHIDFLMDVPIVGDALQSISAIDGIVEKLGIPSGVYSDFSYTNSDTYTYLTFPSTKIDFGNDLITGTSLVTEPTTINVIVSTHGVLTSDFWTDLTNPSKDFINDYLGNGVHGVLGVGLDTGGRGPIVTAALPGNLGRGFVIDEPEGLFGLGTPPPELANGQWDSDNWTPHGNVLVQFNNDAPIAAPILFDSGGGFGFLSRSLFGGDGADRLLVDSGADTTLLKDGTVVRVYNEFNGQLQLMYSFTANAANDSGTLVTGSSNDDLFINSGFYPFQQHILFFCTDRSGCSDVGL